MTSRSFRPDPRPSVRASHVERTRSRVSREAIGLFERQGFAMTTVDQICAAAEISQRTFFRYFATKEAVLFGEIDEARVLARLQSPPVDETVGESLYVLACGWEADEDPQENRRRVVRYTLQKTHPAIGSYLDDQLRQLEPQIVTAVADRLQVHPSVDLRPVVAAQMFGALARFVVRQPPDRSQELIAQWFAALKQMSLPDTVSGPCQ
jgi:AcrR family transcriptional regulator